MLLIFICLKALAHDLLCYKRSVSSKQINLNNNK